jgi:uncharacterized protein YkwD
MSGQRGSRVPRPLRAAGAILALGVLLLTGCMSSDEKSAMTLVNNDRKANGVAALSSNQTLVTKAQNWAQHLVANSGGQCTSSTLSHSDLTAGAPAGWQKLGENVACRTTNTGVSSAIGPIETQFMNSSGHRANILDPLYNRAGIGVASVPSAMGGNYIVVFETQEFAKL